MANDISLKVYNKEDKLKLIVIDNKSLKIANIYKYYGETEEIHSFTYCKTPLHDKRFVKDGNRYVEVVLDLGDREQARQDRITYYDFIRMESGVMLERMWITNKQLEHWEVVGDMAEVKITENFMSENVYEERKKMIGGEIYITEFKNEDMTDFRFTIPEIKINEYLEKLHYGNQEN